MDEISIIENPLRIGSFTSSQIAVIAQPGKRDMTPQELAQRPVKGKGSKTTTIEDPMLISEPGNTYIEEKNYERNLGRSLENESNAHPLSWGKICEKYCFEHDEILGLEYVQSSQVTIRHPEIKWWNGSPDGNKGVEPEKTCFDLKCPMTLKSFCQLVQPIYDGFTGMDAMNIMRDKHKEGETYYWQIVSNAILTNSKWGELIIFVPYKKELELIRELVRELPEGVAGAYYWIHAAEDICLPYLIEGKYYKNINIIRFEIPQADKILLTEKVKIAGTLLIQV